MPPADLWPAPHHWVLPAQVTLYPSPPFHPHLLSVPWQRPAISGQAFSWPLCVYSPYCLFRGRHGRRWRYTCWSTHLVEPGAPHLLPEVIPRKALRNGPPPSALPHPGSSPSVGKNGSIPRWNHSRGRVPSRVPSSQHPRGRAAPLSPLAGGGSVCPSEGRSAPEPPSAQLWAEPTIQPTLLSPPPLKIKEAPPHHEMHNHICWDNKKQDFHVHLPEINTNLKEKF